MPKPKDNKKLQTNNDPAWTALRASFTKSINVVFREVKSISTASRRGKLNTVQAAELRAYAQLLGNMVKQHKEINRTQKEVDEEDISKMSDEEFEKKIKELLKKPKVK